MKKLLVALAFIMSVVSIQAQISDTTSLRGYINSTIVPNTSKSITAQMLSNILNGQLNVLPGLLNKYYDSIWITAGNLYVKKNGFTANYSLIASETDPTIYSWAKASVKPSYSWSEINSKPSVVLQADTVGKWIGIGWLPSFVPKTTTINSYPLSSNINLVKADVGLSNVPNTDATNPANISQSSSYRFTTDAEKSTWNGKEPAITAGSSAQYYRGDKTMQTLDKTAVGLSNVDNTSDANKPVSTAQASSIATKQATLVSGTNIKTINSNSLLGSGDISVSSVIGFTPENVANKAVDFNTLNNTLYPSVQAVKTFVDAQLVSLVDDRGNWSASSNTFPTTGGSGTSGGVVKGDLYFINANGVLGTDSIFSGDQIRALVDAPGQTVSNWAILRGKIPYTPENISHKSDATTLGYSSLLYPTQNAVKVYVDAAVANGNTAYSWGNHATYGYSTASNTQTFTNKTWNGVNIANSYLANSSVTIGSTNIALGATVTSLAGLTSVTATNFYGNVNSWGGLTGTFATPSSTTPDYILTQTGGIGVSTTATAVRTFLSINNVVNTDTSFVGNNYFNKTYITANLATKSPLAGSSSIVTVGTLTSGSIGTGFTAIPNSALANSVITIGSTAFNLGDHLITLGGLTSVVATTFTGALTGIASGNELPLTFSSPLSRSVNTITIATANTSTTGAISSTDWNTFNGKQAALGFTPYNATNPSGYISANQAVTVTATGDATGTSSSSGTAPSIALTLATVNANVGSFGSSTAIPSFTVNAKGLITAASTSVVIAPAGTLTGTTLNSTVVTSSLTSVGTLTGLTSSGDITVSKSSPLTVYNRTATNQFSGMQLQTSGTNNFGIGLAWNGTSTNYEIYNYGTSSTGFKIDYTTNAITTGTWQASTIGVAYGGTGLTTLTSNVIYKGNGTGVLQVSGLTDNGTTISTSEAVSMAALTATSGTFSGNVNQTYSSNSGSGALFPRFTVSNTLATQGDGSSTYNFADVSVQSGNGAVQMFMATTYAAGTWAPAGIINVATNHPLIFKTNNTIALTLASTGAATFSSTINSGAITSTGAITGTQFTSTVQTLTDGATITYNANNGSNAVVTLAGNRTLAWSNTIAGTYYTLRVIQDATGSRTLTLPAGSKVIGGGSGAITLSTAANAVDLITFYYDGTNYYTTYGTNYN